MMSPELADGDDIIRRPRRLWGREWNAGAELACWPCLRERVE
jgi:hypothetical protein